MDCDINKNKKLEFLILATQKDYELYKDAVIVNTNSSKKVLLDEEEKEEQQQQLQPENLEI